MHRTIDWNKVWVAQMEAHHACNKRECASIWEEKESAREFWEVSLRDGQRRALETIKHLHLTPDSRVLDIGAGPGSLAIPLAGKVRSITAVEPSKGMTEVLEENMAEYKCDNISIVRKRWEDIDIEADLEGRYDVVIASFSLGMPDIRKSIEDMLTVASGNIYLYWFAGDTSWDRHSKALWPSLHGTAYHASPKSDVLYNVLYDMGIYPHTEIFKLGRTDVYSSLKEAVDKLTGQFSVTNEEQRKILEQYLDENLIKENGNYIYDARSTRVRMWWSTQAN